jgi:hypothetical protein
LRLLCIGALAIGATVVLAGCASHEPVFPMVPAACLLVDESTIHKDTGDNRLAVNGGEAWNSAGGSRCAYSDAEGTWAVEDDQRVRDAKALYAKEGYTIARATDQQLGVQPHQFTDVVYLITKAGSRGVMWSLSDGVITVVGPARYTVTTAFTIAGNAADTWGSQDAVGIAGQ